MSLTPSTGIALRSMWIGQTTDHRWVVQVLKVSQSSVEFECKRGPSNSRGVRERLQLAAFLNHFELLKE